MRESLKYIVLTVILALGTSFSHANRIDRGYAALKVHDYFKAKTLFTKGLKYNNAAASHGLATIYYRNDNPFHNYDSAFFYVNQSIQGWDMEKQRKKDKWKEFGFTQDSLFALRQSISTKFYQLAIKNQSEIELTAFVNNHTWALERNQAIATRDSIAFFKAVQENTAISYKCFADNYPESEYYNLAIQNYHDSQYNEKTTDGSLSSFVAFIDEHPASPMRNHAERNVFEIVTEENSVESINTFIDEYPSYSYVDTAWRQLYENFLMDYSAGVMESFLTIEGFPYKERVQRDLLMYDSVVLPFVADNKYGFMNESGEPVIGNSYDFVGSFQEGLAYVVKDQKCGFINKHGELQIPFKFESAGGFVKGKAIVELNENMGMIDRNGRYLFDPVYEDIGTFSESMVYAQVAGKYGYYSDSGFLKIPHNFDDAYDFHNGIAKIEKDRKEAYINLKGDYVVPLVYSEVKHFHDTMFVFKEDGLYGIMNDKAQMFVEPKYTAIGEVKNGVAIALLKDRIVYLNTVGKMIIDNAYSPFPNYLFKGSFHDSIAIVFRKGEYGRISLNDEQLNDFEFENIAIGNSVFPAMKDGRWGVFGKDNEEIVAPEYHSLDFSVDQNFIARKNDTVGVVSLTGQTVVPFSFDQVEALGNDLFIVTQNDLLGIYKNEKLIVPIECTQIGVFDEEFLFLNKGGALLYYNINKGKLVQLSQE